MIDKPQREGRDQRPARSDLDLVEDMSDAAAFDRALDELLPKGDTSVTGRIDIDPDDFEAFNRELDAQMAQVKARAARIDVIEDLGTDVVEVAPGPMPRGKPAQVAIPEPPTDEPVLADDVITLGNAATPAASAGDDLPPARQAAAPAPSRPEPAAATAPRPARRSGTLAVLVALIGLVAGGAALWLSLEREAELARLRAALDARPPTAAEPAAPAVAPTANAAQVRVLEGRLEEVSRRLEELSAAKPPAPSADQATGLDEPPTPPAAERPAPAPPPIATTPVTETASSTVAESTSAGASSTPAVPSLPKPSGHGSWAVVIDSYADEASAEQRRAQVARMSLPAEVRWLVVKDEVRYRVVVPGYATHDAANAAAAELRRRKAGGAWVTRLQARE